MIGEALLNLFFNIFRYAFSTLDFISLPLDLMNVLSSFLAYGIWVVGLDIISLFVGSVVFWWTFHMSIGLIVWVWNKLPLT